MNERHELPGDNWHELTGHTLMHVVIGTSMQQMTWDEVSDRIWELGIDDERYLSITLALAAGEVVQLGMTTIQIMVQQ